MFNHTYLNKFIHFKSFGTKRVVQKRRHLLRIIHPEESQLHIDDKIKLPKSLLKHNVIKKLVHTNTKESIDISSLINWNSYICNVKGVRWHPSGSWLVQFNRCNHRHNYYVNCRCYFSVEKYGFFEAKKLAISYRKRLEYEYSEIESAWKENDGIH